MKFLVDTEDYLSSEQEFVAVSGLRDTEDYLSSEQEFVAVSRLSPSICSNFMNPASSCHGEE
jgi:hypothetical protein